MLVNGQDRVYASLCRRRKTSDFLCSGLDKDKYLSLISLRKKCSGTQDSSLFEQMVKTVDVISLFTNITERLVEDVTEGRRDIITQGNVEILS